MPPVGWSSLGDLMFVPFFLIALGVVFLLKNLGVISGDVWEVLWPLILIALGLSMIAGREWRHRSR
jgi:hypothetical protein